MIDPNDPGQVYAAIAYLDEDEPDQWPEPDPVIEWNHRATAVIVFGAFVAALATVYLAVKVGEWLTR